MLDQDENVAANGNPPPAGNDVATAHAAAAAVSIRPPPFSTARVPSWFHVLEAQFENSSIVTPATKFRHAVANLPLEVFDKLTQEDITSNNYDLLKNKIVSLYSQPEPKIFADLINTSSTLTTKPSLYLQTLRQKASTFNLPDEFIRMFFINAMPSNMRSNLINKTVPLNELAVMADNLYDYSYLSYPQQAPVYSATQNNHPRARYQDNNYNQNSYSQKADLSSNQIPINVRAFNNKQRPQVCRYHLYYGTRATKCKSWCAMNNDSVQTMPNSRPSSRSSSPSRPAHSGNSHRNP